MRLGTVLAILVVPELVSHACTTIDQAESLLTLPLVVVSNYGFNLTKLYIMASLLRTLRRGNIGAPEKKHHLSPRNNRKSTRGRVVQITPDGKRIVHS